MSINFAGLSLRSPFIAASGCFGYGWEGEEFFPGLNWGAVTSKTITLKKRQGNPPPRIFETGSGIINRVGLQNCGLEDFICNEIPRNRTLPYPVIVSIFGENNEEWQELADIMTREKVPAIELNLSCPNIKGEKPVKNISGCAGLVARLKKLSPLPLIAKINALDSPVELSMELKKAGIDAIVCSNTFPASILHEGRFFEGGLSGPPIKPVVLKTVREISEKTGLDIAACGGINSLKDIHDYKEAGARAFVLGSILLSQPDILKEWENGSNNFCS